MDHALQTNKVGFSINKCLKAINIRRTSRGTTVYNNNNKCKNTNFVNVVRYSSVARNPVITAWHWLRKESLSKLTIYTT